MAFGSARIAVLQRSRWWAGWWPERVASLLAFSGTLIAILVNFHAVIWQGSGSDYKTLYAAAWCLRHGIDPYRFDHLAPVFAANRIIPPVSWYAHAPVYPPFTLALIAPFTLLPMAWSVYGWMFLSAALLACAVAAIARTTGEEFGFSRPWRMLLIALAAAFPLASFGLEMGNVGIVTAALSILAVTGSSVPNRWLRAGGLGVALLLKPHVAVWVLLALVLMRSTRRIAAQSCAVAAAMLAVLMAWVVSLNGWAAHFPGYLNMLREEVAGGSMSTGNHELIAVAGQITYLGSLLGYWAGHALLDHQIEVALLLAAFAALLWASLRLQAWQRQERLLIVSAWVSFGLIATYHRALDGAVLLLLLPWMVARWRACWHDGKAWTALAFVLGMSFGLSWETMHSLAALPAIGGLAQFLLFRQAPLCALLLALFLIPEVVRVASAERIAAAWQRATESLAASA